MQVTVPRTLYEYACSFMVVNGGAHHSDCEAVLRSIRQLIPDCLMLTDQLANGWHTALSCLRI